EISPCFFALKKFYRTPIFIYKRINNDSPEPLTSKYFISDAKKSVSRKPEPKPLEIRVFLQPEKMER
ncbi:MAG: hypothetical protein Q4F69_11380, partial [Bacteroidia bacterium]|nr:hypothetical protein [Bacteroidia bacterium]